MTRKSASCLLACLPCGTRMTLFRSCSGFQRPGLADQKIAQNLDLLRCPQLLGVNENDLNPWKLDIIEHRNEIGVVAREVIRNQSNPDAGADRILQCDDAVGREDRHARLLPVTADRLESPDR